MAEPDLQLLRRQLAAARSRTAAPLSGGGNGGTYDGMEAKVAVLEHRADEAAKRMDAIDAKLDRILERVSSLPTINGLWGMVAAVIGIGIGIAGLTFVIAEWVRSFPAS